MLNIPEEVKALFKTSDVKKNIRISFPNGERADITNENLIAESLSFTESVCSQESLKFGLIESPVLEFETAGIENIKGKEIEVEIGIDTTTVPEANFTLPLVNSSASFEVLAVSKVTFHGHKLEDISWDIKVLDGVGVNDPFGLSPVQTFESEPAYGSPSNEVYCGFDVRFGAYKGHRLLVTVTSEKDVEEIAISYDVGMTSDSLDFKYYPIKLGRFIVESSPKQADMSRRKVAAYGLSYSSLNQLSSIEKAKRNVSCTKKTPYRIDAEKYVYSSLLVGFEIPGATYNTFYNSSGSNSSSHQWGDDTYFKYSYNWYLFDNESDEQELYRVKYNSKYTFETLNNAIAEYFEENHPSLKDNIISKFNKYGTGEQMFYPEMIYFTPYGLSTGLMKGQGYLYPYSSSGLSYDDYERQLHIPKTITIGNKELGDIVTFTLRENADISVEYVILENHTPIWLEIPRKKDGSYYKVAEQLHYPLEVMEALLETQGGFGLYDRNGIFKILRLSENFKKVNGGRISKSEYKSVWYEDKQSYPYGIVSTIYINTSGEEEYAVYNIPKSVDILDKVVVTSAQPTSGTSVSLRFEQANVEGYYVESPYPIESVEVAFESRAALSLPFEIEPGATEFLITNELLQEQGMWEIEYLYSIDITFEAPTEYSGTFYVSSCTPTNVYYKADECIQYDISNNYLIQNSTFTQEQIETVLKEFAESIKNIRYMPCELDLVGLPYVEAGDVVEIETEAGNFITLVERRTLNGIQSLRDAWQSQSSDEHIIIGESSSYGGGSSSGGGGESAVTSVNGYVGNVVLKTSDLTNDSNYVSDSKYVHTDNNFTAEYKEKVDSNTTARHTHSNKTVLDGITSALITSWNNAVTHISDTVKHITSSERTLWNTVSDKVDKVSGKGLSTNDYTTAEKNKLSGIATGAQVNSITGVKGSAESSYRTGQVSISPANIGLGNVPNVTTNNQTPTYTAANTVTELSSGETLSTAFGKIAKAIKTLISHTLDKNNPHGVTKEQLGITGDGGGSNVGIDKTLTLEDYAADAKSTGDAIKALDKEVYDNYVPYIKVVNSADSINTEFGMPGFLPDCVAVRDAINGAFNSIGIRYNSNTDKIEIKDQNGNWVVWMSANLLSYFLYDNGVQNVQFDFGHVWRYNSYSYKDSVAEETSINITGTSSAGSSVAGTTNTVNITDYNTLVYEVTNNSIPMTLEVDISDLTGSYYIGFGYRYADKEVVYGVTSSKNIGTGSVRTIKKAVSAHTTYINEIKLRK